MTWPKLGGSLDQIANACGIVWIGAVCICFEVSQKAA